MSNGRLKMFRAVHVRMQPNRLNRWRRPIPGNERKNGEELESPAVSI
jgi:hypothetical protein